MSHQASETSTSVFAATHADKSVTIKPETKISGSTLFSRGLECLSNGEDEEALAVFQQAIKENNYLPAALLVGVMHSREHKINKDPVLAAKYLARCKKNIAWFTAKTSNLQTQMQAEFCLGIMYGFGLVKKLDPRKSFNHHQAAANLGNPFALTALAKRYEAGNVVTKNIPQALTHFRKAGDLGDTEALVILGEYYAYGKEAVVKDRETAITHYQSAIKNGSISARNKLGTFLLLEGMEDPKHSNFGQAMQLFQVGVEKNHPRAQYLMGWCYQKKNQKEHAKYFFELAAFQGEPDAQYAYACLLFEANTHIYTEKTAEAIQWFHIAAENGNKDAQNFLGKQHAKGYILTQEIRVDGFNTHTDIEVIPKDTDKALHYFSLAEKQGHQEATENLRVLVKEVLESRGPLHHPSSFQSATFFFSQPPGSPMSIDDEEEVEFEINPPPL